jgi:glyoxylase-like metal-dependent hydrolase (beta-lactamase superfamily II)
MRPLTKTGMTACAVICAGVASIAAQNAGGAAARQAQTASAAVGILPVQGNVSLITGLGANVAVQVGKNGVLLVDTPPAALVPLVMGEIGKLADKPVRFIVNTSLDADHTGGNAALTQPPGGRGTGGAPFAFVGLNRPSIIAHENVLNRMSNPPAGQAPAPPGSLPTTEYFQPSMDFSSNGEAVFVYHAPAAHSDGDSIVLFRRSDVICTGDVYTPGRYPVIDTQRGGTVLGLVAALTQVLALAVPEAFEEGGTQIIPGHGRVSEETDVAEFRDMVVIIKDRIQDLIKKGMSLDQVKGARPSRDYDREYGATPADADRFVESIHRSLTTQRTGAKS